MSDRANKKNTTTSRDRLLVLSAVAIFAALFVSVVWNLIDERREVETPLFVGVLNSQTGPLAASEKLVSYGTILAIEEINGNGGLLGRKVLAVVADGASDDDTFASEAERLIDEEKVSVLVGCYTSSSRKRVKDVVEGRDHLLIYPLPYEGVEKSENVIWTGPTANQQIIPAIHWAVDELNPQSFLLVGSDYIWPRTVNAIVRDQLDSLGLELVDERYVYLGANGSSESAVAVAADAVARLKPDIIINTLVGDGIEMFATALVDRGIDLKKTPMLSFAVSEVELAHLPPGLLDGGYTAWSYFESLEHPQNAELIGKFKQRWPDVEAVNDAMLTAYYSVMLWAQAVNEAKTDSIEPVKYQMGLQSIDSPSGVISIDSETAHAWREVYVGKFLPNGKIESVWSSGRPVRPMPYPISRTKRSWIEYVESLHTAWGGWTNPIDDSIESASDEK